MSDDAGVALPARCGVVGGGRMGAGIAHALLLAGSEVVLVEADEGAAPAALGRVADAVRRSAERGTLDQPADDVLASNTSSLPVGELAKVGDGELGRNSGQGFYRWQD